MIPATVFRGCLSVKDGYPMRLSEELLARYDALGPEFYARARCTAGIRMCFVTKEQELAFEYEILGWCRSTNVADLYENGIMTGSARLPDMQSHGCVTFKRTTAGEALVEIHLPCTCGVRITDIRFGEWSPAPVSDQRVLLLGDSILQGIATYHPSGTLGNLLCSRLGLDGVNQSVGGTYYDADRLEAVGFSPKKILIAMGANDANNAPETYRARIPEWYRKLRILYPDTPAVTVTPIWGTRHEVDAPYVERLREVSDLIRKSAKEANVRVIEGNGLVPHHRSCYNEDGCHPNDLGFAHYALNLLKELQ